MKQIQLANNKGVVLVDDVDFPELSKHKWHVFQCRNASYAQTCTQRGGKRTTVYMHRLIMGEPKGKEIDHIDSNGLNNQRFNLRICTRSQNLMNQRKTRGASQYKGVFWNKNTCKWHAQITKDSKQVYLGSHDLEIECAKLYDKAAIEYFGEFARVNFPVLTSY